MVLGVKTFNIRVWVVLQNFSLYWPWSLNIKMEYIHHNKNFSTIINHFKFANLLQQKEQKV